MVTRGKSPSSRWLMVAVIGFFVSSLVVAFPMVASADENEIIALQQEINALKSQLRSLERRVGREAAPAPAAVSEGGALRTIEDINVSGYVDVGYNINFRHPANTNVGGLDIGGNPLRVFDTEENNFNLHAFQLAFEKPTPDKGIGFRVDMMEGQDAGVLDAATAGGDAENFEVYQAYIDWAHPLFGRAFDVQAGKFVTLAGAEVIESGSNWNSSRSIQFGNAIPFTHTGIRANYDLHDHVDISLGLNNGWDSLIENNETKTLESRLALTDLPGNTSLAVTWYYGSQQFDDEGNQRSLVDFLATWDPTDRISIMANFDTGHEQGTSGPAGSDSNDWQALSVYLRYLLNDWWAVTGRWEVFADDAPGLGAGRIGDGTYQSWTLTNDFTLYKNLLARLEYRTDHVSNNLVAGTADNSQTTVGTELIYSF